MSAIDYTLVITTTLTGMFALANTALAFWLVRQVRTPSGDTLGAVAERTHNLAAVSVKTLHHLNGKEVGPGPNAGEDAA